MNENDSGFHCKKFFAEEVVTKSLCIIWPNGAPAFQVQSDMEGERVDLEMSTPDGDAIMCMSLFRSNWASEQNPAYTSQLVLHAEPDNAFIRMSSSPDGKASIHIRNTVEGRDQFVEYGYDAIHRSYVSPFAVDNDQPDSDTEEEMS